MISYCIFLFCILVFITVLCFPLTEKGLFFGEALPLVLTLTMLILFLSGLLDYLNVGLTIIFLLFIFSVWRSFSLIRKQPLWDSFHRLFTREYVLFLIFILLCSLSDYRHYAYVYDELSHWADTVKAMFFTGRLSVFPSSDTYYPEYPPADSILQFLFVRIYAFLFHTSVFREDVLFLAHQIYIISFFLPFLSGGNSKRFLLYSALSVAVIFAPFLFSNLYTWLYVDGFLIVLLSCGTAALFTDIYSNSKYRLIYLLAVLITLVLLKPAGFFLAILLAITSLILIFMESDRSICKAKRGLLLVFAVSVPKILWSLKLRSVKAVPAFSLGVTPSAVMRLLQQQDMSYRQTVFNGFWDRAIHYSVSIYGHIVPFLPILLLLLIFMLAIGQTLIKLGFIPKKALPVLMISIVLYAFLYMSGLCLSYCFSFPEAEAVIYASFYRYSSIIAGYYLSLLPLLCAPLVRHSPSRSRSSLLCIIALTLVLLLCDLPSCTKLLISRTEAHSSQIFRQRTAAVEAYFASCPSAQEVRVFPISQDPKHYDQLLLHYVLRPNYVPRIWRLCPPDQSDEGAGALSISPEKWRKLLVAEYDYVVIFIMDDFFEEEFSYLFNQPLVQGETAVLWKVDPQSGTLNLCETP